MKKWQKMTEDRIQEVKSGVLQIANFDFLTKIKALLITEIEVKPQIILLFGV